MWPTFYIPSLVQGAELIFVGAGTPGCEVPVIYYRPADDTPAARAGDLCVMIVLSDGEGSANAAFTMSHEWSRWLWTSANSNYLRAQGGGCVAVLYRILTAGDLTTTFSFTHTGSSIPGRELCSRAYIVRKFDADIPLDCFAFGHSLANAGGGYANRFFGGPGSSVRNVIGDLQFSLLMGQMDSPSTTGNTLQSNIVRLSEPLLDAWTKRLNTQGEGVAEAVEVGVRITSGGVTNNFANEGLGRQAFVDWTLYRCGLAAAGSGITGRRYLTASGTGTGRSYIEQEVTLTAGQRYSWHTSLWSAQFYNQFTSFSVVPPSGDSHEFGFVTRANHSSGTLGGVNDSGSPFTDPDGGRLDWWYGHRWTALQPIVNATYSYVASILFTAQETGVHKFRVGLASGANWADTELSLPSSAFSDLLCTALFDGYVAHTFLPSAPSTVERRVEPGPVYYLGGSSGTAFDQGRGAGGYSFVVNSSSASIVPAIMIPYTGHMETRVDLDAATNLAFDGSSGAMTDDTVPFFSPSRSVYPTVAGAAAKYYFEILLGSVTGTLGTGVRLMVGPHHAEFPDKQNNYSNRRATYYWDYGGEVWEDDATHAANPLAWGTSPGDYLGCMVDYTTNTVKFYINGTLKITMAMNTASGLEHHKLPFTFLWSAHNDLNPDNHWCQWTANLRGPFGGRKPSGALAWDWKNEVP